ncbi:protein Shroom isoform X2 [Trichogramma pretiosum]|uniref:protein Shroom isoform X2 n=1 Tax=Trichogramma pretiosum TaxID=7493 RepID=UPI000C71A38D|nr:protein Shroom isoform X2 [Trichogramma pretiosum]
MTTELQPPGYRGQQQQQQQPDEQQQILAVSSTTSANNKHYHRQQQLAYNNGVNDNYEDRPFNVKKNAPGYKNDSGYSESLGFESFSVPISERDATSPPPIPPVRDLSSLKPTHDKYPSWPANACYPSNGCGPEEQQQHPVQQQQQQQQVAVAQEQIPVSPTAGPPLQSTKNWTEQTNYPKEKQQQQRTATKRPNSSYTQQVPLYGETDLMAADPSSMDDYTTVQHSQQASYAQSEGYHSYVSSVDSTTTTTPFLDRLRRDSEAVQRPTIGGWEESSSSREGRDSVVTTSSGSASSSETLKWHGSMSDVSVSSGMPASTISRSSNMTHPSERWTSAGSMTDLSSINGSSTSASKSGDDHHQHSAHQHRNHLIPPQWLNPTSWNQAVSKSYHSVADPRLMGDDDASVQDWDQPPTVHSSLSDIRQDTQGGQPSSPQTPTSPSTSSAASKQLIAHSSRVQTPQRHHSESVLYLDRERNQRKLYPVSTTKLDEKENITRSPPASSSPPQSAIPTVAERVSELEKQQMRYTYLDPEKRLRVSDPTLKAIQKKALLSFYERHQQHQQQASWRSEPQLNPEKSFSSSPPQQSSPPPPQPPPRPRPLSARRASSASDYAAARKEKTASGGSPVDNQHAESHCNGATTSEGVVGEVILEPRHQHSNSCGSLSSDLVGPVIIGPAISIDDWVPERPPKKPHLRAAFSERLPSPDLPPPSPPMVTEVEVNNPDAPLPPPPPEISQDRNSEMQRSSRKLADKGIDSHTQFKVKEAQQQVMNEKVVAMGKSSAESRPNVLADLLAQKYSDSGCQRASPQVPVVSSNGIPLEHNQALTRNSPNRQSRTSPQVAKSAPIKGNVLPSTTSPITSRNGDASKRNNLAKYQTRNYLALPPKYTEAPGIPSSPDSPPPLAPRISNAKKISPPPRPAPPIHNRGSQSKASYLAYRRERGAPECGGSYKRTMSPNARVDDPVLLKVTQQQQQLNNSTYTVSSNGGSNSPLNGSYQQQQQQSSSSPPTTRHHHQPQNHHHHELGKSQSSDALLAGRKSEENGKQQQRLSPQSVEALNDRNRQLERERRKLAASCEPRFAHYYREHAETIEMTSQNVEMLNRKNERQRLAPINVTYSVNGTDSNSPPPSPPRGILDSQGVSLSSGSNCSSSLALTEILSDRSQLQVSSPTQTDNNWNGTQSLWNAANRGLNDFSRTPTAWSIASSSSQGSSLSNGSAQSTSPCRSAATPTRSTWQSSPASPRVSPQPENRQSNKSSSKGNASTNDVASQTEELEKSSDEKEEKEMESLAEGRKKTQAELDCEELSRDLAEKLAPNDKLLPILVPGPEHKQSTDYIVDLFRVDSAPQPRSRPKSMNEEPIAADEKPEKESASTITTTTTTDGEKKKIESLPATLLSPAALDTESSPLSTKSSNCLATADSKARFLDRMSTEQIPENESNGLELTGSANRLTPDDNAELQQKKEELMVRLDKKLVVLRAEQDAVREEEELNEALGARLAEKVSTLLDPIDFVKYQLHVEEIGEITSLLLGLSGRLALTENILYGMESDQPEKKTLEIKRDRLTDQLEEAKILKLQVDRRSASLSNLLAKYLDDEEIDDYQHFINMKAKIIIDANQIQDKVNLGEEQLAALKEAIDL